MLISNLSLIGTEWQKSFNFDVLLPDVNSSLGSIQGIDVSPFIQSISFGQYSMEDLATIQHGSLKTHSAGMLDIKEVSMEFICPAFSLVFDYFEFWRSLIWDSNALCHFIKANYVNGGIGGRPCLANLYDSLGNQVYSWTLVNLFPKTFPALKLDYAQQEIVKFTIDFAVDQILPNNSFGTNLNFGINASLNINL